MLKKTLIFFFIFFSLLEDSYANDEYFLTLRNDKVNLRQGPSFEYPIKIFYKKKFLPVLVQDDYGNFKKIRDHENNSGWIHISQLSKKKAAITIDDDVIVFNKPSIYSNPSVILKKGRLCKILKCKEDWCKIKVDKYKGWIKKNSLWGLI
jgi:SH3-like domain-containing protein